MTAVVDEPWRPILCSSLPLVTPPNARSTMNARELLAVDLGEDDEDVGEAAVGDPHLLAVQHEAAVAPDATARVFAPSASEPEPDSLRRVRADRARRTAASAGICASAPPCRKATAAESSEFACAPKAAPNEADRAMPSLTIVRRHLVEFDAAVCLRHIDAEQPEVPAAPHQLARQVRSPSPRAGRAPEALRCPRSRRPSAR